MRRVFPFLLLLLLLSGCASTSRLGWKQSVLVRSEPEGAEIFVDNKLVGTTPRYVFVERARQPEISLGVGNGERKTFKLRTEYRWSDSFFMNFWLLTYAPLGWVIDLATGNAWDLMDPAPIKAPGLQTPSLKEAPAVAIAPPKAEVLEISDQAAKIWQANLAQRFPKYRILNFEDTLSQFAQTHHDFKSTPSKNEETHLYATLGVGKIFESQVNEDDLEVTLQGQVRDIYTGKIESAGTLSLSSDVLDESGKIPWYLRGPTWLHLMPNTGTVEYSSNDLTVSVGGYRYYGKPIRGDDFNERTLSYLGTLGLTHLEVLRPEAGAAWHFSFVPAFRFSYRRIQFEDLEPVRDTEFRYLLMMGGIGPELSFQVGSHDFYLNMIPMAGWHQIDFSTAAEDHAISQSGLSFRTELGYLYFLTKRLSARAFARATTTPSGVWDDAFYRASNGEVTANSSATDYSSGIAIGYTIEPIRKIRNWKIKQK